MKRLLVVSHASVLEVNRDLFYSLADQAPVEVKIVCPNFWNGGFIRRLKCEANLTHPKVEILPLPVVFSGNGSLFFYAAALRAHLGEWQPDVVFIDEEPWSLACAQVISAFPRARKLIYTKQNLRKEVPFPFSLLQKRALQKADAFFSVSDEVSEVLRWKGYRGEIHYLPHSFDDKRFRPLSSREKAEVRNSLGLRQDTCVIGYFGRLEPEKGIHDLFQAIRLLEDKPVGRSYEALIVGNGALEQEAAAFAEKSGRTKVTFRRAIPHHEVGRALAAIDIHVLPSRTVKNWKEQFGRILVEAMACEVALVGSDSGEIPHLIRRGNAGLVFPEGDAEKLAICIEALVADPALRGECQKNGRAFVMKNLTHDCLARTLAGYLGLSSAKEPARQPGTLLPL